MYCTHCGKEIGQAASYCPHCGNQIETNQTIPHSEFTSMQQEPSATSIKADVRYSLPLNHNRSCDIQVFSDHVTFSGKFWYLRDKDFYRNRGKIETALIKDFLGMGYLAKRSYRQTVIFVFGGTFLEIVKAVVDKLSEWVDKANNYLKWIDHTIALPEWMNITVNVMAFLCIALGIALFFSKKKVIEISFTTKRICIPQKSLSADEFQKLRGIIKSLKG